MASNKAFVYAKKCQKRIKDELLERLEKGWKVSASLVTKVVVGIDRLNRGGYEWKGIMCGILWTEISNILF